MTVRDGIRALGLLGAAAVLVGCGAGVQNGVALQVAPRAQRIDQPFTVVLGGLHSGQAVIVALRSTDASGVPWASSTSLRANPRGQARAGLRLLSSMQPAIKPGDAFYIWRDRPPQRFTVTARASGHTVATTSFTRGGLTPPGVSARMVTPAQAGFAGELFAPAGRARRGAVVVIGGSSGGLPSYQAAALAGAGYPALAVAYFKYPGLPPTLSRIPLEYFARALTWLSRQPGVDPARLLVLGVSRGSEAALLLGVHYPRLVHGVIGMVPSDVAVCSFPGCKGPAWTLDGKPLPYATRFDPATEQAALIPVERIRGPILVACGEDDQIWDSCDMSQAIMARLNAHHDRYVHVRYAYPNAGHYLGLFVPDEPENAADYSTFAADEQGRALLWPRLLAFLGKAA